MFFSLFCNFCTNLIFLSFLVINVSLDWSILLPLSYYCHQIFSSVQILIQNFDINIDTKYWYKYWYNILIQILIQNIDTNIDWSILLYLSHCWQKISLSIQINQTRRTCDFCCTPYVTKTKEYRHEILKNLQNIFPPRGFYLTQKLWNLKFRGEYIVKW